MCRHRPARAASSKREGKPGPGLTLDASTAAIVLGRRFWIAWAGESRRSASELLGNPWGAPARTWSASTSTHTPVAPTLFEPHIPAQLPGLFAIGMVAMYIYADETGNSGRNIFDQQPIYRQGAILCAADAEPALQKVIFRFLSATGLDRLHAHNLPQTTAGELALEVLNALDEVRPWQFHVTTIEKPYLATTKFVDTVFDAGENLAVPSLWYNFQMFRHVLCCAIDDMLTPRNRERFWWAFLVDDMAGIQSCIRNAETYLDRITDDQRLRQVVRDAFQFALRHPEELTLSASRGRRAYQGDTPNMVAFSSLLQAVHDFVDDHQSPPVAFYHDRQQEFGRSMQEMHELFGPIRREDGDTGLCKVARADYDIGRFSMPSSKEMAALQATDLLLWIVQRENAEDEPLLNARTRLDKNLNDVFIARWASETIVRSWLARIYSREIDAEELAKAQRMVSDSERARLRRMAEFEIEKLGATRD